MSARHELDPDLADALAVVERVFDTDGEPPRVLAVHTRPRRPQAAPAQRQREPEAVQPSLLDSDPQGWIA